MCSLHCPEVSVLGASSQSSCLAGWSKSLCPPGRELPGSFFVGNMSLNDLFIKDWGLQRAAGLGLRGECWCPLGEDTWRLLSPKI